MKAKAAVLYEYENPLSVEDVNVLDPKQGEVLVRLVASGVCHSDLHVIDGLLRIPLPIILGHEGAGVVEAVGPGVTTVKPGDHVVISWVPNCGRCHYCTIGRPNLCIDRPGLDGFMGDGTTRFRSQNEQEIRHFASASTFSAYTVVQEEGCVKIREDAPLDKACLVGCGVMTGVGAAINTAKVRPGSSCVVIGCGGVGLNAVQGCAIAGADKIIAVDINPLKLEFAKTFGATHTINGREENVVERVKELTGGLGAEYSFEVISTVPTIRQAWDCLRPGGTCVVVGIAPPGSEVNIPVIDLFSEKVLTGSVYGGARMRVDIPMLVDMYMDGKLKIDELISRTMPLDGINDAFNLLKKGEVARSVILY